VAGYAVLKEFYWIIGKRLSQVSGTKIY